MLIVYNPSAGGARSAALRSALDVLSSRSIDFEVYAVDSFRDATDRVRSAGQAQAYSTIVAAGGDGTVRQVVSGLMSCSVPVPPLGILPLGTTNVLARELCLPMTSSDAAKLIVDGNKKEIVLGTINGHYFTSMVGIGFDARVVKNVSLGLKAAIGRGAYVFQAAKSICSLPRTTYRLQTEGSVFDAASIVVAKSRYYAGNFSCAPCASVVDSTLHFCLFTKIGRVHALRYMAALVRGQLDVLPDYHIVAASLADITGPPDEPVQADGDIVGTLPARLGLAQRKLTVLGRAPSRI